MIEECHGRNLIEHSRYDRQIKISALGSEGQRRIEAAKILCVGAGGLGSPVLMYLAAAGVGQLDVVDFDCVSTSNLHRQILFRECDEGKLKNQIAQQRLTQLNSQIHTQTINGYFSADMVKNYNLVIDGSDNFTTKLAINDACFEQAIPWVYGAVNQLEGQVAIFWREHGACYRCLFANPSRSGVQSCEEAGVLGPVVGVIGSCQATLALQHIVSQGNPAHPMCPTYGTLQVSDFMGQWQQTQLKISTRRDCPTCYKLSMCCFNTNTKRTFSLISFV